MRRPKIFGKDLKIILTLIKGQLISKGLFGVFNSSKKQMKTSGPEVS